MRNHKRNIAGASLCLITCTCVCVCVCAPVFDPVHRDVVAEHRVDDIGQLVRIVDRRVQREFLKDTRVKNYIGLIRGKYSIEMF